MTGFVKVILQMVFFCLFFISFEECTTMITLTSSVLRMGFLKALNIASNSNPVQSQWCLKWDQN